MKITDDMLTEWRKQFEAEFPMPPDCIWAGKGYVQTHYNAWRAQAYAHMWDGFVAARRTTPDSEFEFTDGVRSYTVRGDKEAIGALLRWKLDQQRITENALRLAKEKHHG